MALSRNAVCNTRCQMFHKEMTKKQERLRTLWFIKNQQRLYDNLGEEHFSEKLKSLEKKKKKTVETKSRVETVEKPILPPWRPSRKDVGLMRPMKSEIKSILYAAKDTSFVSKKKYFHERYKSKPEDRFYYPYCSSWVIGWRLKDYPETRPSKYGVRSVIHSTFYRKNASSLQRDPDWYRMCLTGDPTNFNEILTY